MYAFMDKTKGGLHEITHNPNIPRAIENSCGYLHVSSAHALCRKKMEIRHAVNNGTRVFFD